jgi:hypothetical protein
MSHNGLKHCVVPRDVAHDVGHIRPEWVRHLDGFEVKKKADEVGDSSAAGREPPDEADASSKPEPA